MWADANRSSAETEQELERDMNGSFALAMDHSRFETLATDALLPVQYVDLCRNAVARPPELRLRLAVLEDAVRCYQNHVNGTRPRAQRLFNETAEWFAADAPEEPFSFVNICAVLGIDAEYFRAGLERWRALSTMRRPGSHTQRLHARRIGGDRHVVTVLRESIRRSA
jgi:hypothetical protein